MEHIEIDPAEVEGYEAYIDGEWVDLDNPYQPGTQSHNSWLDGWDRAYREYGYERYLEELDANEVRKYR